MYRFHRWPRFVLLFVLYWGNSPISRAESPSDNVEVRTVTLSEQEIDRQLATGKAHEFTVTSENTLVDSKGRTIEFRHFKKYLKTEKCDKRAYFVLWVAVMNLPPEKLVPIVSALADYGVENVVLRRKKPSDDAVQAARSETPVPGEGTGSPKKILILKGGPNPRAITATDSFPDLAHRPRSLRPHRLPAHVRYVFASDEAVTAAADLINRHLLTETPADGMLFGDRVFVNAGAWLQFRNNEAIGHRDAKPLTAHAQLHRRNLDLEGMVLTNSEEISTLEESLRKIVAGSGGGVVRALRTAEMERLWTFIAIDIEEPVLVLETNNHRFLFILNFTEKGLISIDELNGLPDN